jgi:hypothetical protein
MIAYHWSSRHRYGHGDVQPSWQLVLVEQRVLELLWCITVLVSRDKMICLEVWQLS